MAEKSTSRTSRRSIPKEMRQHYIYRFGISKPEHKKYGKRFDFINAEKQNKGA